MSMCAHGLDVVCLACVRIMRSCLFVWLRVCVIVSVLAYLLHVSLFVCDSCVCMCLVVCVCLVLCMCLLGMLCV